MMVRPLALPAPAPFLQGDPPQGHKSLDSGATAGGSLVHSRRKYAGSAPLPSLSPATIPPNIPDSAVYQRIVFTGAAPSPHPQSAGSNQRQTPLRLIPMQPHTPLPNIRPRVNCCSGMSTSSNLSLSSSLMPKLSTVGRRVVRQKRGLSGS